MVTFAQAQERAEEWVNGDVAAYQHREVRVREFELGFVVWAEDRADGPVSDGGRQRLVIARDSGEATLWPGLPVGEVIRRYEEEYAVSDAPPADAKPPQRVDLNQTSFLLTPPEWLQEAADRLGIPDHRAEASSGGPSGAGTGAGAGPDARGAGAGPGADPSAPASPPVPVPVPVPGASVPGPPPPGPSAPGPVPVPPRAPESARGPVDHEPTASDGVPAGASATPWAGTDTNADSGSASVPLPATVFAPPLSGADDDGAPPPVVPSEAPTALMSGGSQLPRTSVTPSVTPSFDLPGPGAPPPGGPAGSGSGFTLSPPGGPGGAGSLPSAPGGPAGPGSRVPAPDASDIADAATSKAVVPPRGARGSGSTPPPPPPPPGVPGAPGARPGAVPPPPGPPGVPGASTGGHLPTQLVSQQPGPPAPPGSTPPPGDGAHHAATMLAGPGVGGPGMPPPGPGAAPGAPHPPGPVGAPGGSQQPPPPPGSTPPPGGGLHHAATMLASPGPVGPSAPPPPGPPGAPGASGPVPPVPQAPGPHTPPPPAYGHPQQPAGPPTVGPGYQAVLRFRAPDGSEQQLIRRSAPGTPHPEWQMLHELRAMNVPPQQVIELHTELESCELPGGYCARMIRETWPQVRITSVAPYGTDHTSRQQGMRHLLTHQGELHQVADGPARPAPVRAPLPQLPPAPAVPPEAVAEELLHAFGPQGILRFDQRAVSRQGVPEIVARTLVWAGLPADFGPFFWAQPGQPVVPTLGELAMQRQIQPASDAGSYLVMGSDFGRAICVQYGTANIVAVPVEAGPGGQPVPPQFVNTGLPEFIRSMALLGRMWRLRFGLNPEQAGRWTVDFQAQLVALDPAALASPESWWSVLLEQMWDGLL
ncbi:SUKH-4 family immunity protein [Streptomyces sp. AM 4-1-1]|uniref:SUKH-4 family immunity protein n=1 Tax=Streptomyces sp. AM 4-1-1 TaxID=3028710 RepID=UPI0023BA0D3A|nr:SUKH-4 family immunity protein [Streptomyces sp. AM 4-1-1]WEH33873.1 SUKH-4 family immunity protein [Streptomyces sp. AM 4-1-1]